MADPLWTLSEVKLPELAEALRGCAGRILERFPRMVRESLPNADGLTLQEVTDNLPTVLEHMAAALERAGSKSETREVSGGSLEHGQTRFDQNFNLGELMQEYALLRRVIMEEVAECIGRALRVEEILAINAGIDLSVRRAVVTFVNQQKHEVQVSAEAQAKHLSFLSHDLRGSLNGILLMIEVLKRELQNKPEFAESIEDLDMMRRSILETVTTMDRFLYAERFRKGKVVVKNGPTDVAQVVSDVIAQFSYQAKDKDLELKSEMSGSWPITSDRALISVILQNVIGNAVKFTRKGRVVVTGTKVDGGGVRVTVADTGPGIEAEKLGKMFIPFTRGETHGQEGVGLGLSIARQAADLMGAKLWGESEVGRGSRFHLELRDAK